MEQAIDDRLNLVFTALADASRRKILLRLTHGPAAIIEIAKDLPFTRQAATKHLRSLLDAGLVRDRKLGREVVFELTPQSLEQAETWMRDLEGVWDRRLIALQKHLED